MSASRWMGEKCAVAVSVAVVAAVTGIAVPDASGQVNSRAFISRAVGHVVPIDTSVATPLPQITLPSGPETVATSPDGRRAYVTNYLARRSASRPMPI